MIERENDPDHGQRANSCVPLVVSPPITATPLIALEAARLHLRLDATGSPAAHPDDELIADLVAAAQAELDGWDGNLGRALMTQAWEYRAPYFSPCEMAIPLPPLQAVLAVQYLDTSGALQTLSTDVYRVVLETSQPGRIVLKPGQTWPETYAAEDAVRVQFRAGYGDTPDDVPGPIKTWVKLRLGQFYENREAVVVGTIVTPLPQMDGLVDRYRIRRVFQ